MSFRDLQKLVRCWQEYERYRTLAEQLLTNLEEFERRGDLRKACEVLWGAVVNYTKAYLSLVCEEPERVRSLRHRELRKQMKSIVMSAGEDPHLVTEVEALHSNFYEDFMDAEDYLKYKEVVLRYLSIINRKTREVLEYFREAGLLT